MPHLIGGSQPVALAHNFANGFRASLGKLRGALVEPQATQEFALLRDWVGLKAHLDGQLRQHGEVYMRRQVGLAGARQRVNEFMVFHGLKTVTRRGPRIAIVDNQRSTSGARQVPAQILHEIFAYRTCLDNLVGRGSII